MRLVDSSEGRSCVLNATFQALIEMLQNSVIPADQSLNGKHRFCTTFVPDMLYFTKAREAHSPSKYGLTFSVCCFHFCVDLK